MSAPHVNSRNLLVRFSVASLFATMAGCGPPLTDPSPIPISGRWTTADRIGQVSIVSVDLAQKPDGTVTGTWTADVSQPSPSCPGLNAHVDGPVTGKNTIFEARLAFIGVGDFQGQLEETTLRGSFASCGIFYPVTFSLVGPVPGG